MFYNLPYILEGRSARDDSNLALAISEASLRFGGCFVQVSFGNPAWVKHLYMISSEAMFFYDDVVSQYYHVNVLVKGSCRQWKSQNQNGNFDTGTILCRQVSGICYMDYICTDALPAISYGYKMWPSSYPHSCQLIQKAGSEVVVDETIYKWIVLASHVYSRDMPTDTADEEAMESMAYEIEESQKAEYRSRRYGD